MDREASQRGGMATLAKYGVAFYQRIGSHHRRGRFLERQAATPRLRREAQPIEEVQPPRTSPYGPRRKRQ